ncbi:hypothetical protein BD289DRAFT_459126 [Coniella lustricola]|uniref:Ubiquitin-like domain-containing protein n=1 Tax=Coniella lustricola TaxID=2025994 RepID=A0A2T3AG37_9PEZI|nr:hypothetical protein BD289DRAFT_459126 [Coniella lustricola]
MAEEASSSSAAAPEKLPINISIVSPSLSVNTPLNFPGLPASTTLGQLKQNIRDALDSKPTNEQQRLIHQGKLLAKEDETLLQVFGEQKIRDTAQFVVHLVIRDIQEHRPVNSQAPAAAAPSPSTPHHPSQPTPPPNFHGQPRPQFYGRPVPGPVHVHSPFTQTAFGMPTPQGNMPDPVTPQQQQILQQYLSRMNQRPGAPSGTHVRGASSGHATPDLPATGFAPPANPFQGQFSPQQGQAGQTYVQESVGLNGEVLRVTMNIGLNGQVHPVNVPSLQPGHANASDTRGSFTPNDVQNVFRNADANQATSIMTGAMQRSASGASLANLNLNQRQSLQTPGVTIPGRPGSSSSLSRTATPIAARTPSQGTATAQANRTVASNQAQVYILNSPQGPRALLVNNLSDMYYTPAPRIAHNLIVPQFMPPWLLPQLQPQPQLQPRADATIGGQAPGLAQFGQAQAPQQAQPQGNIRVQVHSGQGGQQPVNQQQVRAQPLRPAAAPMHPGNPEGGLAGALAAALWPHVWLLIRLAVFVWWFTSADTSWTRWLLIMGLATAVFLINTGIFNGMANDVFQPIRQHLEGLIPFAGPEGRNNNPPPVQANGGDDGQPERGVQGQGELDPARVAARLVEQRRDQNASWLLDQIRRLERASLLLLASILPGVAERHIARLEAEARAERDRQEAAERAERERREEEERAAAAEQAAGGEHTATEDPAAPDTVLEGNSAAENPA